MASRVAQLASASALAVVIIGAGLGPTTAVAQAPPYDVFPAAEPPYFRVRYQAGTQPGELIFPVSYTIWIPPGVTTLRGVVVHQHGCGEGQAKPQMVARFTINAVPALAVLDRGRPCETDGNLSELWPAVCGERPAGGAGEATPKEVIVRLNRKCHRAGGDRPVTPPTDSQPPQV